MRHALQAMLLRRVAKIATLVILFFIGASVIATPVLLPEWPGRRVNRDAPVAAGIAADKLPYAGVASPRASGQRRFLC